MEGLVVDASSDVTVALDTHVDEGLMLEMLAREIVNRIQTARKDQDFAVTDRISVTLHTESEFLSRAAQEHRDYIMAEVLAASLEVKSGELADNSAISVEIGEEMAGLRVVKIA
jgi:isoleucyl-tRNA synthetase